MFQLNENIPVLYFLYTCSLLDEFFLCFSSKSLNIIYSKEKNEKDGCRCFVHNFIFTFHLFCYSNEKNFPGRTFQSKTTFEELCHKCSCSVDDITAAINFVEVESVTFPRRKIHFRHTTTSKTTFTIMRKLLFSLMSK